MVVLVLVDGKKDSSLPPTQHYSTLNPLPTQLLLMCVYGKFQTNTITLGLGSSEKQAQSKLVVVVWPQQLAAIH